MAPHIFDAWTRTNRADYPLRSTSLIGLVHVDRLIKIRDMILSRPLISEEHMIEWGRTIAEKDLSQRKLSRESTNSPKKKGKSDQKDIGNQSKAAQWAKWGARAEKIQEIRQELARVLEKLQDFDGSDGSSQSRPAAAIQSDRRHILSSSPLARVRVGSSCSTKLNYILNEVSSLSVHI